MAFGNGLAGLGAASPMSYPVAAMSQRIGARPIDRWAATISNQNG